MADRPANDLLLRALALEPTPRPPLWVMRQAGRYLPEYRAVRARAGSFTNLCRDPELACEVTMQPVERFGLDAAIVFSDILTIPDALGLGLDFAEGAGPWLERPVTDEQAVDGLGELDVERLRYVADAVGACARALEGRVPLIGFAGGPFTLACYMVDGRGGEFLRARAFMHARPDAFARLLAINARAAAASLAMQAAAGADVLMLFDSWASLVPPALVPMCLADPLRQVIDGLAVAGCTVPLVVFWRDAGMHLEQAMLPGVAGLGVGWREDLGALRARLGDRVALQGNIDPAVLLTDPATIRAAVEGCVAAHGGTGHVLNLGHGINKQTPPEHMAALAEAVRSLAKEPVS